MQIGDPETVVILLEINWREKPISLQRFGISAKYLNDCVFWGLVFFFLILFGNRVSIMVKEGKVGLEYIEALKWRSEKATMTLFKTNTKMFLEHLK